MKRFKKILCFVLPVVLVVAIAIGIILPVSLAAPSEPKEKKETKMTTAYAGQVAYAADSTSGAATAAKDYKGGAIFLEPNSAYNMSGGTISGHKNTYGGAIYISSGATFTMTGGTISGNTATYGGAIYVENGGKCYIRAGEIKGNKATAAPAIYVETGGTLEVSGAAKIENNKIAFDLPISAEKEIVGLLESGVELYTTTFGSYPRTYAGESAVTEMENWIESESPEALKTFTTGKGNEWVEYNYNGELFVRGTEKARGDTSYEDGTGNLNNIAWFKVEPIKWYILNYDAWQAGEENANLLATQIIASDTPFYITSGQGNSWENSDMRKWCNTNFYMDAFNETERGVIKQVAIKNNVTGDSGSPDGNAPDTQDYIYLMSHYEMTNGIFSNSSVIACTGTDFAIGNGLICWEKGQTVYNSHIGRYYLRSAGTNDNQVYIISALTITSVTMIGGGQGVRPALQLNVAA